MLKTGFSRPGSRAGFTLMELLVAVGLMVILITAVVVVFVKSTQVFRKAESLMEIFQNARAAIGTVGREVAGSFPIDSNNQEFIIANPRNPATGTALRWGDVTGSGGVTWTVPLVVTITQTAWVDSSVATAPRVVGAAKVLYRLRNDPVGLYRMRNTTVTLERVLLKPEKVAAYYSAGGSPNLIDTWTELARLNSASSEKIVQRSGGAALTLQEDLCKFIRYQPSGQIGSFHVEYFFVDPTGNATNRFFAEPGVTKANRANYPVEPPQPATGDAGIIHFSPQNTTQFGGQPCFQNLPIGIRIKMQVVDDQSNEVRTVARDIWIPAARTE